MDAGFYRAHLASRSDDDWVVVYLPLGSDGLINTSKPAPFLVMSKWGGEEHYGEYRFDDPPEFHWAPDGTDIKPTDLGQAPVKLARPVTIWESDHPDADAYEFVIKGLERM